MLFCRAFVSSGPLTGSDGPSSSAPAPSFPKSCSQGGR
ncbi:hypothetical protein FH063_005163 [Azospirillum argentinense]|uniref:Uncharacterized protein n=1 Tax=Azospirillum argentinense TaxID=2970906 RepID=A0A5B0KRW1_9PROT|nr:hypothetical protein FH063_005163 [Azospirillum argentinense]